MQFFEVEVRRISTIFVEVEAASKAEAAANYKEGLELSTFIEDEAVVTVIESDDRFIEDEFKPDDYEAEELADDDYSLSSN